MLIKFIKFAIVGGSGAIITFGITWLLTEFAGLWYMASLCVATGIAMTSNFLLNNYWTFGVRKITPDDADYEWHAFYKGNPVQRWWKRSIANIVWEWIPNSSALLDIGCGSSPIIGKYPDAIAVDRNAKKLEFLKSKFPTITVAVVDIENVILEYNSFDYVLCIEVLEHIINPGNVVRSIANLVKEGGKVVLATPDYGRLLWHIAEKFTPYEKEHVTRFTRESLEKLCLKYGLVPIEHKHVATCDLVELFEKRTNKKNN